MLLLASNYGKQYLHRRMNLVIENVYMICGCHISMHGVIAEPAIYHYMTAQTMMEPPACITFFQKTLDYIHGMMFSHVNSATGFESSVKIYSSD